MDGVALASVLSSATLGAGTLIFAGVSAATNRHHELSLRAADRGHERSLKLADHRLDVYATFTERAEAVDNQRAVTVTAIRREESGQIGTEELGAAIGQYTESWLLLARAHARLKMVGSQPVRDAAAALIDRLDALFGLLSKEPSPTTGQKWVQLNESAAAAFQRCLTVMGEELQNA